ncbi:MULTISPECIES: DNA helicase RecQ [Priestia]|uniref:DNA helicase RecQ n=1 Tax=Priestia TaxID=2800373 RepID=UPI0023AF1F5A|nr:MULTISPECIES: DNA helicase RecQ [Priestia]MDE8674131.1 DNA helicase RecQ [Priestia aryabhattai]WDC90631.1 DNA helicase RecQ [Priestia megaterium]
MQFEQALTHLQSYFGYDSFRKGQEESIRYVLEGHNTACIMPTGGGKSLCYQIPSLLLEGTTLVISPLISLMKDQVDTLNAAGIPATYINSSLTHTEVQQRLEEVALGEYKLLYVAPERLESPQFLEQLQMLPIPLVAVDEAHCISQWGHDFRPSYLRINELISKLSNAPIVMGLTATATPQVREDICRALHINEEYTVMTGFERENLSFAVVKGQDRISYIDQYIRKNDQEAGIIYAATRKDVEELHARLQKSGVNVSKYHAGMNANSRDEEQNRFLQDDVQVMIATSAFGMGIDKSNIRFVLHYQLPKNMESYYQEAGRAGRDGLPSECIVLYSPQDIRVQRFLIEQSTSNPKKQIQELEKLQSMVNYCHTEGCLQAYILHYFGESEAHECGRCSNCTDDRVEIDVTVDTQKVLSCMIRMGERFGKMMIAQVLTGSRNKKVVDFGFDKLKTYGVMSDRSAKEVSDFIEYLISEQFILVGQGSFPTLSVAAKGKGVLLGTEKVMRKEQMEVKQIVQDDELFAHLRSVRKQLADEAGVPPFVIFSDDTLHDMCTKLPVTLEQFATVKGVGEQKQERYGERFTTEIKQFCEDHPDRKREVSAPAPKKARASSKEGSHLMTYELFQQGKSLDEIAEERELSRITIENHLFKCAEEEKEIDWSPFLSDEDEQLILQAASSVGDEKLKPIKEELPENITYFMIKVALFKQKMKQLS